MKSIFLLLPDLEIGGAQRVMLFLANRLKSLGFKVNLLVILPVGPLIDEIPSGINLIKLNNNKDYNKRILLALISIFKLRFYLKKHNPDYLLSSVTGTNCIALFTSMLLVNTPKIIIREAATLKNVTNKVLIFAMRLLYPHANKIIALTPAMSNELVNKLRLSAEKIVVIPNPVDYKRISMLSKAPVEHHWFNDERLRVIISVGRLVPQKDHITLLKAFSLIPDSYNARLIIVGDGPERGNIENLIKALNISDKVFLSGRDNNPWRWMARSDLYILSSLWEGHPNSLLEALYLGLPAIVTIYDSSVLEMKNKFKFYTTPSNDPESMKKIILQALSDSTKIHAMTETNNEDKTTEKYISILK